jgi:hypothetical protein
VGYLDVVGQEQRLPLVMRGHGIGPKAYVSYDVLDIGTHARPCTTTHANKP